MVSPDPHPQPGTPTAILSFSAPGLYYGDRAACRELARRCNDYLAGFTHLTRNDDRPAGHADFEEIYRELDRRRAMLLLHPAWPADSAERGHVVPRPIVDYPGETARATASLLFNGVLARMPDIRFILSHAAVAPLVALEIGILAFLTAVPAAVTWLPRLMAG